MYIGFTCTVLWRTVYSNPLPILKLGYVSFYCWEVRVCFRFWIQSHPGTFLHAALSHLAWTRETWRLIGTEELLRESQKLRPPYKAHSSGISFSWMWRDSERRSDRAGAVTWVSSSLRTQPQLHLDHRSRRWLHHWVSVRAGRVTLPLVEVNHRQHHYQTPTNAWSPLPLLETLHISRGGLDPRHEIPRSFERSGPASFSRTGLQSMSSYFSAWTAGYSRAVEWRAWRHAALGSITTLPFTACRTLEKIFNFY